MRILCLKGYLSAKEREDGIEYDINGRIDYNKQIEKIIKITPGINGFDVNDSLFLTGKSEEEKEGYLPSYENESLEKDAVFNDEKLYL